MTRAFSVSQRIDRPVEEVWSRLTDWEAAPGWMPGVESMSADGPIEVGTNLTFRARGKDCPSEITAVTPGPIGDAHLDPGQGDGRLHLQLRGQW
jgi:uncharacterized protein YndB with AHSA1/START domain